jgi:hypothetical protein
MLQGQKSQLRLARAAVKARLVADIQMNTETAVDSESTQIEKEGIKAPPGVFPPRTKQDMLKQAAGCVERAKADGINRYILRTFLPKGEGGELTPLDESWEGGIMQLYAAASPLTRELLSSVSNSIAGVPPRMKEQRLDASGVDGESLWVAESSKPEDDGMAFVMPSQEQRQNIERFSKDAGGRGVLIVNPQWRERDDPLDALSRQPGLIGSLGNFLGGKAGMEKSLDDMGFRYVYTIVAFSCRGSSIFLQLAYPYGWTAFYKQGQDDPLWKPLIVSETRPLYKEIEEALIEANVPFRLTEFELSNVV